MLDTRTPLRTSYYQLLNNHINVNSANVPVYTDVKLVTDTSPLYVLITEQSSNDKSTFDSFSGDEDVTLEIIGKSSTYTNKEDIDSAAAQIMQLVQPSRTAIGLAPQSGLNITNLRKVIDRDLSLQLNANNSMLRRVIVYRQRVSES